MLSIHNLNKHYGIQPVLKNINFNINAGERIGLIGANGSGKTTLMRILAGLEPGDSGDIASTHPRLRLGYLAQGIDFQTDATLHSALGLDPDSQTDPAAEIESLALALSQSPNDSNLQAKYDSALARLSTLDLRPEEILAPLGLDRFPADTPIAHLSGGQKTRLMLAKVLLNDPHLLLLDEPTNHLDIEMLEWLEDWLNGFKGAALIVSHDRAFLDNTVTQVLELDSSTHSVKTYDGNYSGYLEQKLLEFDKQAQAYQDQQDEIAQLKRAARHIRSLTVMKKGGKADGGDKFAKGFFGNRATKNVAGKAKNIEARIDHLLTDEKIDKPQASWKLKLDFGQPEHQSKDVLVTESLSIGYAPENPLLTNINLFIRAGQRVVLTGANGSGKTTFIRTIVGKIPPLAGSFRLGGATKLGYMAQEQELLDPALNSVQTIQSVAAMNETETRNFLHYFLFKGDAALRPAGELSFGERARLQLALLVAQGCTFLILDEPINHLDIPSRERFEEALENFNGTILAIVHDRSFIERFATDVWVAKDGKIMK
ncbi:MAG: ABC-F family ATP-binding cassette domain-containing protein [Anaerolineales bacterium]|jgi:ATP-binding cassette subfamily F protein 3|nr:ABC-F family ATP-binding cassette domain-containing protein [Anaerolineales bacterium]MCC6986321.1 ABC-F family ATP-binding cassette domain-containing protein [Anaerolineales bacterium]